MFICRSICSIVILLTICFNEGFGTSAQKKGIFDVFYEDDDIDLLDELPAFKNKEKYEIVYDTRQKGEENYRLNIDGVHVVMNSDPISSDLLETVETMYGLGGTNTEYNNDEIPFIIESVQSISTTSKKGIESESKDGNKIEAELTKTPEKIDVTTTKTQTDPLSLKRNTDFIKRR